MVAQKTWFYRFEKKCFGANEDVNIVFVVLYLKDSLFVVSHAFEELQLLLLTWWSEKESFQNFERRFLAQLARSNALGDETRLENATAVLYFLNNANKSLSQWLSILVATSHQQERLSPWLAWNDFVLSIKYVAFATVIK